MAKYFSIGHDILPKLPLPLEGGGPVPPPNTWYLWPTRVYTHNSISIRNKSALIQLAQGRFTELVISSAKNKIYWSSFIKHHSETVMVWNYQNTVCNLRKKFLCVIYYNFWHTFVPIGSAILAQLMVMSNRLSDVPVEHRTLVTVCCIFALHACDAS